MQTRRLGGFCYFWLWCRGPRKYLRRAAVWRETRARQLVVGVRLKSPQMLWGAKNILMSARRVKSARFLTGRMVPGGPIRNNSAARVEINHLSGAVVDGGWVFPDSPSPTGKADNRLIRRSRSEGPNREAPLRLELWLIELIAAASAGLRQLNQANSPEEYRRAAEQVADRLGPFVGDALLLACELDRRP